MSQQPTIESTLDLPDGTTPRWHLSLLNWLLSQTSEPPAVPQLLPTERNLLAVSPSSYRKVS
jgi:hypothetical protein